MFCRNCGRENADGAAFCINCGAKLVAEPYAQPQQTFNPYVAPPNPAAKPVKKKNAPVLALGALSIVLAIALALSLTGVFGGAAGAFGVASTSFASPEDAINYFVDRFKAGDFSGALAACGINETAKNFDYKAYVERIQTLLPVTMSFLPSEYKPYVELNKAKIMQQILMQMTCFTISLNLPEEYSGIIDGQTLPVPDGKFPDGLMEAFDPSFLGGLEVVKIGKMSMHDSDANRKNQKKTAKTYGADDEQFRAVLYKLNGDYYVGGFTVIQYGGRWFVNSMSDPIAGISAFGTPNKLSSEAEFENILGN